LCFVAYRTSFIATQEPLLSSGRCSKPLATSISYKISAQYLSTYKFDDTIEAGK